LRDLPADAQQRFLVLLYSSLWGNRIDLSYAVSARVGRAARLEDERINLLVDDAEHVWSFVRDRPGGRVAFLQDNSGTELLMDLALADFLLQSGLARRLICISNRNRSLSPTRCRRMWRRDCGAAAREAVKRLHWPGGCERHLAGGR